MGQRFSVWWLANLMPSPRSKLLRLPSSRPAEPGSANSELDIILRGNLSVVSTVDLLQWLCSARQSWNVRLYGQGVDGDVVVSEGELLSARWGGLFGLPALTEVVACNWGSFDLLAIERLPEQCLFGSWQNLLLDAVHELDKRQREQVLVGRSQPPLAPRLPVSLTGKSGEHSLAELFPEKRHDTEHNDSQWPTAAPSQSFVEPRGSVAVTSENLIDQGFAALRAGNLTCARQRWIEALLLDPDNRTIQFNLRKLESIPPPGFPQ